MDQRALLETLIRDRGEDYASLSKLIGRNPAYIQQFIKRGVPRRLAEEDRRTLARYFRIDEAALGGPATAALPRLAGKSAAAARGEIVLVPRLDIGASAGPGADPGDEPVLSGIGFEAGWLREIARGGPAGLSMIRVSGDSMVPTLSDGDEILVDQGDGADRLRDGIYVLRVDEALMVKRVAINPLSRTLTIVSDNPAYPPWPDCDPARIVPIGRVVWAGRRIL